MQNIVVRKGRPEDAHHFSELVTLSSPKIFQILFGSKVKKIMKNLFRHRRHYYSFDRSFFADIDGKTVGMAQLHKLRPRRREKVNLGLLLFKYMKWSLPGSVASLLRSDKVVGDFSGRNCYLSNLAVYPEYRGLGIGTRLMDALEEEAKSIGKKELVLHADINNKGAIKLYERLGYRIDRKIPSLRIKNKHFEYLVIKKKISS